MIVISVIVLYYLYCDVDVCFSSVCLGEEKSLPERLKEWVFVYCDCCVQIKQVTHSIHEQTNVESGRERQGEHRSRAAHSFL